MASSFLDGEGPSPDVGIVQIAIDSGPPSGDAYFSRMAALHEAMAMAEAERSPGARRLDNRAAAVRAGLAVAPALLTEFTARAGEAA